MRAPGATERDLNDAAGGEVHERLTRALEVAEHQVAERLSVGSLVVDDLIEWAGPRRDEVHELVRILDIELA